MTIKQSEQYLLSNPIRMEELDAKDLQKTPYKSTFSFGPLLRRLEHFQKTHSSPIVRKLLMAKIEDGLKQVPAFKEPIEDYALLEEHQDLADLLFSCVVSPLSQDKELIKVFVPGKMEACYLTPALRKLIGDGALSYEAKKNKDYLYCASVINSCALILNRFYDQNLVVEPPFSASVQHPGTNLQRHFKTNVDLDYVDIIPLKPLKKLDQSQINQLLSNIFDLDLWMKYLPPENFEFQGFLVGHLVDITEEEALSRLKFKLLEKDAVVTEENIRKLEKLVRLCLKLPDLQLGLTAIDYPKKAGSQHQYKIRFDLLSASQTNLLDRKNTQSVHEKACRYRELLLVEDLEQFNPKTAIERQLLRKGFRSIIVAPLVNKDDQVIGLLEVASQKAYELQSFVELKVKEIVPLFALALERSRQEIDNQVEAVIREQFTAVHPSVEWKFVDTAFNLLVQRELDPKNARITPINFQDVYPLYGQSDIVNSSDHRNESIRLDLIENLEKAAYVLDLAVGNMQFPLAHQYLLILRQEKEGLENGAFNSNDESRLINLLQQDIHPLLEELKEHWPTELETPVTNYFNSLDKDLHIIYNRRKAYEESVTIINNTISNYLEVQQKESQKILPHYFERYKTDGVEYDIYIGQSLLKSGQFKPMHLRNLRLWQVYDMCEITRLVHHLQDRLPMPLTTAQLIFAYGSTLSIQFRMDEKQFDVDGAYNVRYEILKKRIDKALIEGREERLTMANKVAIVYLQDSDKQEYLEYISYLRELGFIKGEIEDLQLARLQGVQGLRALRFEVDLGIDPPFVPA